MRKSEKHSKSSKGKKPPKGNPVPVRFDPPDEAVLDEIVGKTGLSKAELIRRAGCYAFPKFLSGEINILDVVPA